MMNCDEEALQQIQTCTKIFIVQFICDICAHKYSSKYCWVSIGIISYLNPLHHTKIHYTYIQGKIDVLVTKDLQTQDKLRGYFSAETGGQTLTTKTMISPLQLLTIQSLTSTLPVILVRQCHSSRPLPVSDSPFVTHRDIEKKTPLSNIILQ